MSFADLERKFYQDLELEPAAKGGPIERLARLALRLQFWFASWISPVVPSNLDARHEAHPDEFEADPARPEPAGSISLEASIQFARYCHPARRLFTYSMMLLGLLDCLYCFGSIIVGRRWEQSYQSWQPSVRGGLKKVINGSITCALASDIELDDPTSLAYEQACLAKHLFSLDFITKFTSFNENLLVARMVAWSVSIGSALVFALAPAARISSLSFLINPEGERAWFRRQLTGVVKSSFSCSDLVEKHQLQMQLIESAPEASMNSKPLIRRQTRPAFRQMVLAERLWRLVVPSCLSGKSRRNYSLTVLATGAMILNADTISILANFASRVKYYLGQLIDERLKEAQCELWHPNATQVKPRINFEPDFWAKQKQLYLNYKPDSAPMSSLYLVELAHFVSNRGYWLHFVLIMAFFCILAPNRQIYLMTLVTSFHFQTSWQAQLLRQLDLLDRMMCQHLVESRSPQLVSKTEKKKQASARVRSVHKAMAVAYYNFELFRRQYRTYKRIASHIAGFYLLDWLSGFAVVFRTFEQDTSEVPVEIMVSLVSYFAAIIVRLNALFLVSAIIVMRMQRISRHLLRNLARASSLSIEMSHISNLWRRQVQSRDENCSHYALSVFGVLNLSLESMLTLDSYMLGLALIMYKVSSGS